MASKMFLSLVRKKISSSSSPPSLGGKWEYLTKCSSSSSRRRSLSSSPLSPPMPTPTPTPTPRGPTLMLKPEYDVTDKNRVVNFRFFTLGGQQQDGGGEGGLKMVKKKVPQSLWDASCVGSSHGWLAYYNRREYGFYLANFVSPDPTSSSSSPEIITLPSLPPFYYRKGKKVTRENVTRVFLSAAPNNNNNLCECECECGCGCGCGCGCAGVGAVVVVVRHQWDRSLSFCRLGRDESWTCLFDSRLPDYADVLCSNKNQRLYALCKSTGDIEAWDLDLLGGGEHPHSPQGIETHIDYAYPHHLTPYEEDYRASSHNRIDYLVESPSGDILRVRRYVNFTEDEKPNSATGRFDVYKLDFEREKGEYVHNLGDTALFLGFNHSFALSVGDYPELIPNSIYFVDVSVTSSFERDQHFCCRDTGVYDLERHTVAPLYPSEWNNNILPPLIWLAPNPNPR